MHPDVHKNGGRMYILWMDKERRVGKYCDEVSREMYNELMALL